MFSGHLFFRLGLVIAAVAALGSAQAACVWKVTGPNGATLYLGGSIHGLRATDYPLPSAYNRAFDASSALVIEEDINVSLRTAQKFYKSGFYSKGDSLKNHVDPRTYDYLRRLFAITKTPEIEWSKCKPWMLDMMLFAAGTNELGIEAFLLRRARANRKAVIGLESFPEHEGVLSGLSDKQAELVLLLTFIPEGSGADRRRELLDAWRSGDVDKIARMDAQNYHDLPSFGERLIGGRNRNWIPKIEDYLAHHRNYFVVAGAAHFGGPNGVLALLKARGYRIEQL